VASATRQVACQILTNLGRSSKPGVRQRVKVLQLDAQSHRVAEMAAQQLKDIRPMLLEMSAGSATTKAERKSRSDEGLSTTSSTANLKPRGADSTIGPTRVACRPRIWWNGEGVCSRLTDTQRADVARALRASPAQLWDPTTTATDSPSQSKDLEVPMKQKAHAELRASTRNIVASVAHNEGLNRTIYAS
jgi:hypothetical protein